MKTNKNYFAYLYLDKSKVVNHSTHFEVIKVKVFDGDHFEAELKARRFCEDNKLGKLAGGSFPQTYTPYDFKTNYKVWICPDDYKPARISKQDKFIINLIEEESKADFFLI